MGEKQLPTPGLEPWTSRSHIRSTAHSVISPCLLQLVLFKQQALLWSKINSDHSKRQNESVKNPPEKSKNILEEKRKTDIAENLDKKDQHVYNNCSELRSRAIKMSK